MQIQCNKNIDDERGYNLYYIGFIYNNEEIENDDDIAILLHISLSEYSQFLKSYNYIITDNGKNKDILFLKTEEDCKKCIEDIKKKYNDKLVYLSLIENTIEANKLIKKIENNYR
jgi:hypothetical protein